MDSYNIQVMLKDGSITDYFVQEYVEEKKFEILQDKKVCIVFTSNTDGTWTVTDNPANIDSDLEERITNQLNGYRR